MIPRLCALLLIVGSLRAQDSSFSKEKESAIGASIVAAIGESASRLTDPAVNAYIERLGQRLAGPVNQVDWKFAVVRDDLGGSTHEPLSLPGGYIFIPASLIQSADDEAELAGTLAHSMAHITNRDSIRMAAAEQAANPSRIPLISVVGGPPNSNDRSPMPGAFLKMQQNNELGADRVALTLLAAAGYDPAALPDYIRRTQKVSNPRTESRSALPPKAERLAALEAAAANLPVGTAPKPDYEFKAIQQRLRELL